MERRDQIVKMIHSVLSHCRRLLRQQVRIHITAQARTMHILQFQHQNVRKVGVLADASATTARGACVTGAPIIDLCACDANIPTDIRSILEGGDEMLTRVKR